MVSRATVLTLSTITLSTILITSACGEDDAPPGTPTSDDAGASSSSSGGGSFDAATTTDNDSGDPDASRKSPYVHRDVNHILSTGQSLSVGAVGSPPLSTTQPYANTMFSRGVMPGATMLTAFAPLTEGTPPGGVGPNVETMSSGLANLVTKMAREELLVGQPNPSHDMLVSVHGIGGTAYVGLKKGTSAFTAGIAQAQAAFDLTKAMNKSYIVRVTTTVHGESDHVAGNTNYEANLLEWQSDYEKDVQAITGQIDAIPMLQTQMSSWTKYNSATSLIPSAQLAAHRNSNGKVVLVGPKYHLAYAADGVHLTNAGYIHMGEDYAKAYRRIVLEGERWEPVRPLTVTRDGAVLTVKFAVPAPPLVLDTTLVKDPGSFGFEVFEVGAQPTTITKVEITGPDTVTITLSKAPGANARLRYAFRGVSGAVAGPQTGARGNLRDSDATPSRNGNKLYNWCVHFDEPMP